MVYVIPSTVKVLLPVSLTPLISKTAFLPDSQCAGFHQPYPQGREEAPPSSVVRYRPRFRAVTEKVAKSAVESAHPSVAVVHSVDNCLQGVGLFTNISAPLMVRVKLLPSPSLPARFEFSQTVSIVSFKFRRELLIPSYSQNSENIFSVNLPPLCNRFPMIGPANQMHAGKPSPLPPSPAAISSPRTLPSPKAASVHLVPAISFSNWYNLRVNGIVLRNSI